MRPDEGDLDEEIRGHLAINIKERIERGEDPAHARRAALMEFGYVPAVRDEMRRVWYSRWYDHVAALARDIRFAVRSLARAKALTLTVVVTLALGIGANAAIFSVVRSVLLRPLVNREADRLIYIRQGAQGLGIQNLTFSVPEINDFKSRATTVAAFGDFSTVGFTMIGFAREPRLVRAGVVNGSFFEVMGLRPVLGRLLSPADDGPGGGRGGADASFLERRAQQRSGSGWPDGPSRFNPCDRGRRPRAIGAVSNCYHPDRMRVRAASGSRHARHDFDGIANRQHRL